jgi:hypothetical protein
MDGNRFDELTRSFAGLRSRRSLLRKLGLASSAAVATALGLDSSSDAAEQCRPGGSICRKHGECCSGNCLPKDATGRQRCSATSTCTGQGTTCCPGSGPCALGTHICCNGSCVAINELTCGTCGNSCGVGETCCKVEFGVVGGPTHVCADLQSSQTHCGTCGNDCAIGQVCCNGQCVPLDQNCTACGVACPGPFPGATVTCIENTLDPSGRGCFFVCNAGFADCNDDYTDGCETVVPPPSAASCGFDNCNLFACPDGTTCTPCGSLGAGICCQPGQVCGPVSETVCGCVAPGGLQCSMDPTTPGRFIR